MGTSWYTMEWKSLEIKTRSFNEAGYTVNGSQRGPFTVNIMNGVGWTGVPTLPLRPLRAWQSWPPPKAGSRVHAIICMADGWGTGSHVSPAGETDGRF